MDTVETIQYRGIDIEIHYDQNAGNPWEEWDCQPPMFVLMYHGEREYGLDLSLPELTRNEIKANLTEIKSILGQDTLLKSLSDWNVHYRHNYNDVVYMVNEALEAYAEAQYQSDRMDLVERLYQMKGYDTYSATVTGYCQGDWADVLLVATPEWREQAGCSLTGDDMVKSLKNDADLYRAWAFGDVYGYSIEETEDSCWGFYTDDHERSGLLEYARNAIDCHLERKRKVHLDSVKTMIKHHVPLAIRQQLVARL